MDLKDELKLYHEKITDQLRTDANNGNAPLTPDSLMHILDQAWAEIEHDRNTRADKWAKSKGLI